MPRPKKYKMKEQQRQAIRAKSASYYERNSQKIKTLKQVERERRMKKNECKLTEARILRCEERELEQDMCLKSKLTNAKSTARSGDLIWRLRHLHNRLDNILLGCGTEYVESLYTKLVDWLDSGYSPTSPDSPVTPIEAKFYRMADTAAWIRDGILRKYGQSERYQEADNLVKRFHHVGQCISDLLLWGLAGDLQALHNKKKLPYQSPAEEKWLNYNFINKDLCM
ncbi:hypothetical protein AAF712_010874 [Marasmius tenuissimus]|uniref:Uncharacterized protein n=1 Tax=Marasmius tenuissimus TaxID=585030 RepID=A0ABR2ZMT8_9AGAR